MQRAKPYDRNVAIDAATALFWAKGFHATSLKDLEAALMMKPGSIYAAFHNKETLFGLCLERYFETNKSELIALTQTASSPLDALAQIPRDLVRRDRESAPCDACMLVKTVLAATPDDLEIAAQATTYLSEIETVMAGAFNRAKQLGEIPNTTDVNALARTFQSNITALKIEMQRGLPQNELERSAEDMARRVENLRQLV